MKGDLVIARCYGHEPIIRRVWDSTPDVVYICTEERYQLLNEGVANIYPVGFPRQDVFEYEESVLRELATDPSAWNRLNKWERDQTAVSN